MASPRDAQFDLEFPENRAHVYYAAPQEALQAAFTALESTPHLALVHVSLSGYAAESGRSATVDITSHAPQTRFVLAFDALPLGSSHTRFVIRCIDSNDAGDVCLGAVAALQSAMDKLLTGG